MEPKKIFILDTNVLVHDPFAPLNFAEHTVCVPLVVLEELDHFKSENTSRGKNTRQAIRLLDDLRGQGSLKDGVLMQSGGILRVIGDQKRDFELFRQNYANMDNEILVDSLKIKEENPTSVVRLITKDINMRVKADAIGLEVEDYMRHFFTEEDVYKGWISVPVPSIALKHGIPDELYALADEKKCLMNQYFLVHSENNEQNYKIFKYRGGRDFVVVEQPHFMWPIIGKNPQQIMAFDALMDPDIQFVTLIGGAGTGKTFLALVAGLHEVLTLRAYERLLITRPVIPLGPDIGYLPGDVQEKMHSWMQPIYDNMDFIVHLANKNVQNEPQDDRRTKKKDDRYAHDAVRKALPSLDALIQQNKISLEAITYMRGRSIPYQYILIDEVQNLTPHEVKTLVTRVGEGSKIILAGDPFQIDSPYLDFSSNGLVVSSEKFKNEPYFATIFMQSSERSLLSQRASELL